MGKPPVGERILTTMLITDIAGSTDRAAAVGDAAWDQLLDRHHALVREILERYRGTEIDTAGDGFLTMFDGAARAVQSALEIRAAVRGIGLDIRAGVHTGEVDVVPGGIRGLAVHETARIMALGNAGDILVSSTTRELSADSGFSYVDRGIHHLKGIPAPRRISCSPPLTITMRARYAPETPRSPIALRLDRSTTGCERFHDRRSVTESRRASMTSRVSRGETPERPSIPGTSPVRRGS